MNEKRTTVTAEEECPLCGTEGPVIERPRHVGPVYFVDRHFPTCGHVDEDTEGGI